MTSQNLTYEKLREYTSGKAVALRARIHLQPAGGKGTKIFPPTYSGGKYALEEKSDGDNISVDVLLDSVSSQANRAELELLRLVKSSEMIFPVPAVDFKGLEGYSQISALEAPHRIVDAIFRDSFLDGARFRTTDIGRSITDANARDATAIYNHCPSALLFGIWDSTGPKGGLGSKFQRAFVSEIIGHDAEICTGTSSRLDPLQIHSLPPGNQIYKHKDEDQMWTLDESKAAKEKDIPVLYGSKKGNQGKPSNINHGNIAPSADKDADGNKINGGVTISKAEQTIVLSLAALRKLEFGDADRKSQDLMKTSLAALGLCAMVALYNGDIDLRSRCLLVPQNELVIEVLERGIPTPIDFNIDMNTALNIFKEAADTAKKENVGWSDNSLQLEAGKDLEELVRLSSEASKVSE